MTSLDVPLIQCPHCRAPIHLEPVPPCHEQARCGNCGLKSPRFPRYTPTPNSYEVAPRKAVEWIRRSVTTPTDNALLAAARRMVVAWDKQDAEAAARALEALRGVLEDQ